MSTNAAGEDPILDAIGGQVDGIVTAYVVVAEFIDCDGTQAVFSDVFEGQQCHRDLGLLTFGMAGATRRAAETPNLLEGDD